MKLAFNFEWSIEGRVLIWLIILGGLGATGVALAQYLYPVILRYLGL